MVGKRKGQLTPMQRVFSSHMADTGARAYSAEKAGYAKPATAAAQLMATRDVAEDVRRRVRHKLQTEGAELGANVLMEIAADRLQKGSTRVNAAWRLVQLSGVVSAQAISEADLAEMPADQIRALLAEAQRALSSRLVALKTIDHEPAAAPESADIAQAAPNLFD